MNKASTSSTVTKGNGEAMATGQVCGTKNVRISNIDLVRSPLQHLLLRHRQHHARTSPTSAAMATTVLRATLFILLATLAAGRVPVSLVGGWRSLPAKLRHCTHVYPSHLSRNRMTFITHYLLSYFLSTHVSYPVREG